MQPKVGYTNRKFSLLNRIFGMIWNTGRSVHMAEFFSVYFLKNFVHAREKSMTVFYEQSLIDYSF